jgi:hypothetical protein
MLPHIQEPAKCYTSNKLDMLVPPRKSSFVPGQQINQLMDRGTEMTALAAAGICDQPKNTSGFEDMQNKGSFHRRRFKGSFEDFLGNSSTMQTFICGPGAKNCFDSADFRPVVANHDIVHKPRTMTLNSTSGRARVLAAKVKRGDITQEQYNMTVRMLRKKEKDPDTDELGLLIAVDATIQRWPESVLNTGGTRRDILSRHKMPFGPSVSILKQPKRLWHGDSVQEKRKGTNRDQGTLLQTKKGLVHWRPMPPAQRENRDHRVRVFRRRFQKQVKQNAKETKDAIAAFETMLREDAHTNHINKSSIIKNDFEGDEPQECQVRKITLFPQQLKLTLTFSFSIPALLRIWQPWVGRCRTAEGRPILRNVRPVLSESRAEAGWGEASERYAAHADQRAGREGR